jgi:SET domain-containing protein
MLLIKTSIRPSLIHGIGCFTEENIQKGRVVWEFDERIDLRIPVSDLSEFPAPIQEFLQMYGYAEMYREQKILILCGDNSRYFNHSDNPNLKDTKFNNIAVRDIQAGEELTCNYYSFDLDAGEKLQAG